MMTEMKRFVRMRVRVGEHVCAFACVRVHTLVLVVVVVVVRVHVHVLVRVHVHVLVRVHVHVLELVHMFMHVLGRSCVRARVCVRKCAQQQLLPTWHN